MRGAQNPLRTKCSLVLQRFHTEPRSNVEHFGSACNCYADRALRHFGRERIVRALSDKPEEGGMASIERKSMDKPDETRTPDKTVVGVVHLGAATVARLSVQPGWRWSECIKPVVGGESCQAAHLGYVVSGRIHIASDDGTELDLGPGDVYRLDPGHDAWVLGDEPAVALEFEGKTAETYAKG
jgi:hypothetical protein